MNGATQNRNQINSHITTLRSHAYGHLVAQKSSSITFLSLWCSWGATGGVFCQAYKLITVCCRTHANANAAVHWHLPNYMRLCDYGHVQVHLYGPPYSTCNSSGCIKLEDIWMSVCMKPRNAHRTFIYHPWIKWTRTVITARGLKCCYSWVINNCPIWRWCAFYVHILDLKFNPTL